MMISTRGRYALRVLAELAEKSGNEYVPMKEIAERQGISLKYLERIIPVLSKNGIIEGLQGKGGGYRNAVNSARLFSRLNPYFISVDSLTLFPGTELYSMEKEGRFAAAGEKERLAELQTFIRNLQIRTHLFADSRSNFYPVTAYLPKERESVTGKLQHIMDTVSEEEMGAYRRELKSLG